MGLDEALARPVMFWVHSGAFTTESGSWALHDGPSLASRGDVVVVTINRRLGALGYLHLAESVPSSKRFSAEQNGRPASRRDPWRPTGETGAPRARCWC